MAASLVSIFTGVCQGAVIMLGGIVLFEEQFVHVVRTEAATLRTKAALLHDQATTLRD